MPFEHDIGDSADNYNLEDAAFVANEDVEAEAVYYLQSNLERIRPSVIWGLAKVTDDLPHFLSLLKLAEVALHYPERSEAFAGEAVDSFPPGAEARADTAYRLIEIAAHGDRGWQSLAAIAARVSRKVRGDE